MRAKVIEVVKYQVVNGPCRVATLRLSDGKCVDLTEDAYGKGNFTTTAISGATEVWCVIPPNGGKIIITGSMSALNGL